MKDLDLKVDAQNGCIDRSTDEGKYIEALQKEADAKSDTPMGKFMSQVLAFAEVGVVVDKTMDKKDAAAAMKKLNNEFLNVN